MCEWEGPAVLLFLMALFIPGRVLQSSFRMREFRRVRWGKWKAGAYMVCSFGAECYRWSAGGEEVDLTLSMEGLHLIHLFSSWNSLLLSLESCWVESQIILTRYSCSWMFSKWILDAFLLLFSIESTDSWAPTLLSVFPHPYLLWIFS